MLKVIFLWLKEVDIEVALRQYPVDGCYLGMLDLFFDGVQPDKRGIIFNEMFTTRFGMTGALSFPLFIILVCTLLPQIEYKNNTWKQVLTSPQTKWNIFLAKFINLQLFILLFIAANQQAAC